MKSDSTISSEKTPSKKKPTKAKKDIPSKKKLTSKPKLTKKKAAVEADRGKGVSDGQHRKASGVDEGTCTKPGVPNKKKNKKRMYVLLVALDSMMMMMMKMTDTTHESASQEKSYEQVIEDAHVTLTSSQKIEVIDEVASMMNVKTPHEELSTQAPLNLSVPVTAIPETSNVHVTTSYTAEFEKKAQAKKEKYIDIIEKSTKEIIKDEVKNFTKVISDFGTPVIQSTINESLENVVLAKSSSQLQSTYEAATSLTEFELKKILLDNLEKSKSYQAVEQHRDLYDVLVKYHHLDKDLFDSFGKTSSLKRGRKDKDKDEDPSAGLDQGLKKRRTSKDSKSSGKYAQAEEQVFETADTEMPQDQGDDLVPAFNLLKGTCKSRVELEFHFEEYYKVVTDKLDWTNTEGHEYPFDLSKPLPLIKDQGHQVVSANYFFNNDLRYMKSGSLSSKYTTSTTKTKSAKYDTIEGIEDMVPSLWSPVKVSYDKYAMWGISH
nr:hypothetical protein [Tanacetum cinerariifolium]